MDKTGSEDGMDIVGIHPARSTPVSLQQSQAYIDENDIRLVRFEISDFHGISHCKVVPARHFRRRVEMGLPIYFGQLGKDIPGVSVPGTGFGDEVHHGDAIYHADLNTLRKVPWAKHTARVLLYPKYKGQLVAGYPRTVAERLLGELREMGYSLLSSHEHEFFVFYAKTMKPVIEGVNVRSTIRIAKQEDFVLQIAEQMPEIGVDIEAFETEYAPGQYEIPYMPAFGIRSPDNAFTFKIGIKEIAQNHGFLASFMTRPYPNHSGSSAHLNHSLWDADGEEGLMYDADSPHGLSKVAQHWIAGLLYHAPAISVLMSPTVNCMTRIREHIAAPMNATWGIDNRTTSLRVKVNGSGRTYVENRVGSSAGCPYTSLAATVAAGIAGLKNKYELPPPVDGIAYDERALSPKTRKLPTDMESALEELQSDDVICKAFGEEFIKCFVALKKHEAKLEKEAIYQGKTHQEWAIDYYSAFL